MILAGYTAQVQLIKRALIRIPTVTDIRCIIIDSFQGEKSPFVILTLMGYKDFGFLKEAERQLVVFNRTRDAIVIISNIHGILNNDRRPEYKFGRL